MNIGKFIDFIIAKIRILKQQKVFLYRDYKIKYILEKNVSTDLIVIFSACTRKGIKARYNYMNTLKDIKCNKLFILDDYGDDARGVYYLGKQGDFSLAKGVSELIKQIYVKLDAKTKIYIGSSKGGYAALYFGLKDGADFVIAGAPQYNLGNFVNDQGGYHILKYICGDISEKSVNQLNGLLKNEIENACKSKIPKVYLHYSKNEFTYAEHIIDLKNYLNLKEISYEENIAYYSNHSEISVYFPKYLKFTLNSLFAK